MRLLGGAAGHGLVVGVEVRVIVNLQRQRAESRSQLRIGRKTSAVRIKEDCMVEQVMHGEMKRVKMIDRKYTPWRESHLRGGLLSPWWKVDG